MCEILSDISAKNNYLCAETKCAVAMVLVFSMLPDTRAKSDQNRVLSFVKVQL